MAVGMILYNLRGLGLDYWHLRPDLFKLFLEGLEEGMFFRG